MYTCYVIVARASICGFADHPGSVVFESTPKHRPLKYLMYITEQRYGSIEPYRPGERMNNGDGSHMELGQFLRIRAPSFLQKYPNADAYNIHTIMFELFAYEFYSMAVCSTTISSTIISNYKYYELLGMTFHE